MTNYSNTEFMTADEIAELENVQRMNKVLKVSDEMIEHENTIKHASRKYIRQEKIQDMTDKQFEEHTEIEVSEDKTARAVFELQMLLQTHVNQYEIAADFDEFCQELAYTLLASSAQDVITVFERYNKR